jgi:hypothetical protein
VGFVVKENFAGVGLIHEADGLFRCFDWKSGVADNGDQEQLDRYAVNDHAALLRSHLQKFLTVLWWVEHISQGD